MAPELVEEFIRAFQKEINLQRRENDTRHEAKSRELAEVKRKLDGLIDAIADGLRAPGLQQRLDELEKLQKKSSKNCPRSQQVPSAYIRIWPRCTGVKLSSFSTRPMIRKFEMRPSRSCAV